MPLVPGKPKAKSRTLWLFGVEFATALVALILHYTGAAPLGVGLLATSWVAVVMGAQGVVLRFVTREPLHGAGTAAKVVGASLVAASLGGCGPHLAEAGERATQCMTRCAAECAAELLDHMTRPKPPPPMPDPPPPVVDPVPDPL